MQKVNTSILPRLGRGVGAVLTAFALFLLAGGPVQGQVAFDVEASEGLTDRFARAVETGEPLRGEQIGALLGRHASAASEGARGAEGRFLAYLVADGGEVRKTVRSAEGGTTMGRTGERIGELLDEIVRGGVLMPSTMDVGRGGAFKPRGPGVFKPRGPGLFKPRGPGVFNVPADEIDSVLEQIGVRGDQVAVVLFNVPEDGEVRERAHLSPAVFVFDRGRR